MEIRFSNNNNCLIILIITELKIRMLLLVWCGDSTKNVDGFILEAKNSRGCQHILVLKDNSLNFCSKP